MSKLTDLISELVEEELEEASTSANVPGYLTPYAFSDGTKEYKKKRKKNAKQAGYQLFKEEIEAKDYKTIAQIVRMELASIYYDLYKKKSIWT